MSSACESAQELFPSMRLPTHFEDDDDDAYLQQLALEMEVESSLFADDTQEKASESSFEADEEVRSLVQLPGDVMNSTVWVHTKTGRRAKIILEAQDESENVGLLEYEDASQEIRRMDSYSNTSVTSLNSSTETPQIRRLDTLTVPDLGATRIPSMRAGKNPSYQPRGSILAQSHGLLPNLPSHRAGKNPNFTPGAEVF